MSERHAVRLSLRGVAIGLIAVTLGASCYSFGDSLTDPCASRAGALVVVITGGSSTSHVLRVGDTLTLLASVRPITSSNLNTSFGGCDVSFGDPVSATFTWFSRDTNVARVSATGLVTARGDGSSDVLARDAARLLEGAWSIQVRP